MFTVINFQHITVIMFAQIFKTVKIKIGNCRANYIFSWISLDIITLHRYKSPHLCHIMINNNYYWLFRGYFVVILGYLGVLSHRLWVIHTINEVIVLKSFNHLSKSSPVEWSYLHQLRLLYNHHALLIYEFFNFNMRSSFLLTIWVMEPRLTCPCHNLSWESI